MSDSKQPTHKKIKLSLGRVRNAVVSKNGDLPFSNDQTAEISINVNDQFVNEACDLDLSFQPRSTSTPTKIQNHDRLDDVDKVDTVNDTNNNEMVSLNEDPFLWTRPMATKLES